MAAGLENLKHIVVLMMGGRSFDHMLGGLSLVMENGQKKYPKINGLTGNESNPDTRGAVVKVQPRAQFRGQFDLTPDHRFPGVDLQIFGGAAPAPRRVANMQGFVKDYFTQTNDVRHSHNVMYYFTPDKLPVLSTLATQFAVFNGWFSSIPGPTICNRAFAHYGTSFGQVGMDIFNIQDPIPSIYERMVQTGHTAKIYYYDRQSSTIELVNLLKNQPQIFGSYTQFIADCASGKLPEYSFVEPCFNDHAGPGGGEVLASDQHPSHNVQEGERFIANTYNAIRTNPVLWKSSLLLILYAEHGGIYDHVAPPACTPDDYSANPKDTGTGEAFNFDRLGVRVPAVLVSPYISKGTVVPGPEDSANCRIFEHACIPATVTNFFLNGDGKRTPREGQANIFLDLLSDQLRPDSDVPFFRLGGSSVQEDSQSSMATPIPQYTPGVKRAPTSGRPKRRATKSPQVLMAKKPIVAPTEETSQTPTLVPEAQVGPSTHVTRDRWTVDDCLGHYPYAYALYRFLTDAETKPPLAISIQAPWGGGKTSLMRMVQRQLDPRTFEKADRAGRHYSSGTGQATVGDVRGVLDEISAIPSAESVASASAARPAPHDVARVASAFARAQPAVPPIEDDGRLRRVTVWFNAWKYESSAQVWAGLADCIVKQVGERLNPVERELFWFRLQLRRFDAGKIRQKIFGEVFAAFYEKLISWAVPYLMGIGLVIVAALRGAWPGTVGLFGAELVAACAQFWKAKSDTEKKPARVSLGELVQVPDYAASLGFVHEVVEDLKHVFALIPEKDLPMVIFIDDLDRCSPGKIAAVVEAINLFLAGEFPDCMFILGIDDEMVAAALDKAHSDVIAKLPSYARSTSIGWRFMDKFVQLPFVIPPATSQDLTRYANSLLTGDSPNIAVGPVALDRAAGIVERQEASPLSADQVVQEVAARQSLDSIQQETLKKDVKIIQDMNENINRFTDDEEKMHALISRHATEYFNNPRDMKRFVNLFRFYYFLRAAREALGGPVVSVEQLCRWLVFCLKWPEVDRWLRRYPSSDDSRNASPLSVLERLAESTVGLAGWQKGLQVSFGLTVDQTPWLADERLRAFFHREASEFNVKERLSSCTGMGLW